MPHYRYECNKCETAEEGMYKMSAPRSKPCTAEGCEGTLSKVILPVNFRMDGASAKNGYYIPPTNEQLGMESQRTLRKRMDDEFYLETLHLGRDLKPEEREALQAKKKDDQAAARKEAKRIEKIREKHRPVAEKLDKAMAKSKAKTPAERRAALEARMKKGLVKQETMKVKIPEPEKKVIVTK